MRIVLSIALVVLSSGCAVAGDYPSLAKRPFETASPPPAASPPAAITASDPALLARVSAELQKARDSVSAFDEQLGKSRPQIAAGAAQGSEAWITSQVAASRLEPLLAPAANAAASIGDATAIADRQAQASAELTARLNR
jgi:hypothetical protein